MADITLNRRTDETISFQYYESDGETARTLVGATLYFTVKENTFDSDDDDSDAIISVNVTSHTNAASGISSITISDTALNIDPKNYFYDIKVKENDGNIYLANSGRCLVTGTPTNRSN